MAAETTERSITIAATSDEVWAVLGDVKRMPEWSEELDSVELLEGDGHSPGSRFRGNNCKGERKWSMTCVIDTFDAGRSLEFHTETDSGEVRTRWWYRVEPIGDHAKVTEGFLRVAKLSRIRALAERKLLGDRAEYNARNIDASLHRLVKVVASRS
jgi:uncharacterized protein YndB with AHSA1/START domain